MRKLIIKLVCFNTAVAAIFFVSFVLYITYLDRHGPDYSAALLSLTLLTATFAFNIITLWKARKTLLRAIEKSAIEGTAIAMEITNASLKRAAHFKNAATARVQERSKEKADQTDNIGE